MPSAAPGWKLYVVGPGQPSTTELVWLLSRLLPAAPVTVWKAYPGRAELAELFQRAESRVCFLDAASEPEAAFAVITELLVLDPATPVVVLLSSQEPDLILRCLRQGATEFLLYPFTGEQLQVVIDKLSHLCPAGAGAAEKLGKVYAVLPGKGACGATTLACNLAFQLKRLGTYKVLLADLDPLTGTISFLLKLKSNYSFLDALAHSANLDGDMWKVLVTTCQNIDVLLSPENPIDGAADTHDATAIVNYARQAYDIAVLDGGGVYGEWNLWLARLCDELLLVSTNELPALHAAQRALAYLRANLVDCGKVRLLVNRYNAETGLSVEAIASALHMEVFQLFPSDYEAIQKALMEGKPAPPASRFGKSVATLAKRLAGVPEPVKKASLLDGVLGLFRREQAETKAKAKTAKLLGEGEPGQGPV